MAEIAPILDYASPRKRVKLRLPAKSRIRCEWDAQRLTIIETLEGRDGAIGAIVFAVFTLIYLGFIVLFVRGGRPMAVFWIAEATVLVMVVHQTWRKTILTVTDEALRLRFTSPLTNKLHEWQASDMGEIRAHLTGTSPTGAPLGELRIFLSSGGEVYLFTDHRAEEINDLVSGIQSAFRGEALFEPPSTPAAVVLVDPSIDAARTSGHLLEIRRALRAGPVPKINPSEPTTD